ncbi:glycosyltransferase family 4 protein [Anaerosalibacter sp. Marseille-P3206]|uniref:glycosyltransferase family 4 protein n=1 Tax=Anaerosalibacter sp. Marseille-P3206 TaxID=1871005 RepID=UPI000987C0BB|nr:glycosyltransferase family 4 protein [Anaerosalibacter sp. Marseille-P3206]
MYQRLFDSLEKLNIDEDAYVFIDKSYKTKEEYPSNIYISKCYNKFDRLFFHVKHTKVLNDIKSKMEFKKYDIMHAHSLFSNGYIAYKLNQEYNIPYIVAVRNTDLNVFFDKMIHLRVMGVNILKNAQKVIFISEPYKKYTINKFIPDKYKKEIEKKSVVIPNGIDEFWLKNKFKDRNTHKDNKIKLIYAGNVDTNKNIETTIMVCERLIEQGCEISYKIIGKITDKKYNDFIKKYLFIEYIPYCQKEDLINYYKDSDIFVMPSKHETFGLVYAEAMSQGLPIIYTREQGFDGQFDEGEVGYSVQYDSSEEIVEKIKDILNDYEVISNNCIEKVDRFDWDKIAKEYLNIYLECSKTNIIY